MHRTRAVKTLTHHIYTLQQPCHISMSQQSVRVRTCSFASANDICSLTYTHVQLLGNDSDLMLHKEEELVQGSVKLQPDKRLQLSQMTVPMQCPSRQGIHWQIAYIYPCKGWHHRQCCCSIYLCIEGVSIYFASCCPVSQSRRQPKRRSDCLL